MDAYRFKAKGIHGGAAVDYEDTVYAETAFDAAARCELLREVLIACYQPVESWDGGIGTHLAYLAYAITSGNGSAVVDLETLDETADTYQLYALLGSLFAADHAVWLYVRPLYHTSTTKPATRSRARIYYSQSDDCLRNGSFFVTSVHGPKRRPYAWYMNGDFIGFAAEVPPDRTKTYTCREAKKLLPACNR